MAIQSSLLNFNVLMGRKSSHHDFQQTLSNLSGSSHRERNIHTNTKHAL